MFSLLMDADLSQLSSNNKQTSRYNTWLSVSADKRAFETTLNLTTAESLSLIATSY